MNTPTPANPTPDPTTPGTKTFPTALGAATTTAVAGTPLAVVTVWALETYGTVHGKPLQFDSVTATAIGALGASVIGYLVQVAQGLLALLTEKLTPPK